MVKTPRRLSVQEVLELTAMLREEPVLADLREFLKRKRLDPRAYLLAGFMESVHGKEWGAVVTPGGVAFEYERRVGFGNAWRNACSFPAIPLNCGNCTPQKCGRINWLVRHPCRTNALRLNRLRCALIQRVPGRMPNTSDVPQ